MATDVTVVVNLHKEGELAAATFESVIKAFEYAGKLGISLQGICILDNSDAATDNVAKRYSDKFSAYKTDFGDLSSARNFAVEQAFGKFTTFIDGDDLWGYKWIASCYSLARSLADDKVIIHPRMNLYFGRNAERYFWIHPDMRYDLVELDDILVANRWTALSFANTEIYRSFPYFPNEIGSGFGFEDWLWHIQTIYSGCIHVVAEDTIHFIRKKSTGSLLNASNDRRVIPNIKIFLEKSDVVGHD